MCWESMVYDVSSMEDLFERVKFSIRLRSTRKSTAFVVFRDNFSHIKRRISDILFKHEAC